MDCLKSGGQITTSINTNRSHQCSSRVAFAQASPQAEYKRQKVPPTSEVNARDRMLLPAAFTASRAGRLPRATGTT
jgi:hypothetical protein